MSALTMVSIAHAVLTTSLTGGIVSASNLLFFRGGRMRKERRMPCLVVI